MTLFVINTTFTTDIVCTMRRARQHSFSTLGVMHVGMMRTEAGSARKDRWKQLRKLKLSKI
jgi:hypothetical protein